MKRARTDTYAHTISGLIGRREEMLEELAVIREREGVLANDLEALDRVLETLGYDGPVKLTPRVPRLVLFYRGELRQFLRASLKEHGPSTSRQLAERLISVEGKDARDRRLLGDVVRRIGKALRQMQSAGLVSGTKTRSMGEYLWTLKQETRHARS